MSASIMEAPARATVPISGADRQPRGISARIAVVEYCLTFMSVFLILAPFRFFIADTSLDANWILALHFTFARGLAFGQEVVFTFGPYGFLNYKCYYPDTAGFVLAWQCASALAIWLLARWTARSFFPGQPLRRSLLTVLMAMALGLGWHMPLVVFPLGLLIFHFLDPRMRYWSWPHLFWIAGASVGGLSKFTVFIALAAVVGPITVHELVVKRTWPRTAALVASLTIVLWLAAGQLLANYPMYVRNAVDMAGGYSEAMACPGKTAEVWAFLVLAALALGWIVVAVGWSKPGLTACFGGSCAALLFLHFKEAFTRQDPGHLPAAPGILATLLLLVWAARRLSLTDRRLRWGGGLLVAGTLLYANSLPLGTLDRGLPAWLGAELGQVRVGVDEALATVFHSRPSLRERYEHQAALIRAKNPGITNLQGTVDVFHIHCTVPILLDLHYRPRPTLQSYSAYLPQFAELNAAHLRGADAPDHILFDLAPVDGRFPALEDSLCWLEMLARYRLHQSAGDFLHLVKSPSARAVQCSAIKEERIDFNQLLTVPPSTHPIWVKMDLRPSARGAIANTVFRSPPVFLEVTTGDGKKLYRLTPGQAQSGFLLSPVIASNEDFAKLLAGTAVQELSSQRVTSIRLIASNPSYYADAVAVSFFELQVGE